MKKIIYIILCLNFIYAFAENSANLNKNYSLNLFIDSKIINSQNKIYLELSNLSNSNLDEYFINYFIKLKYQNVTVTESFDNILNQKKYVIKVESVKKIKNIYFQGVKSLNSIVLQKGLKLQSGKEFKDYFLQNDIDQIEKNIRKNGFPSALFQGYKIQNISQNLINIYYFFQEKKPCEFSKISIVDESKGLSSFKNFPIENGSLCDIENVESKLRELENEFQKKGYLNAKVEINNIEYFNNNENANLYVKIDKGQKTIIEIRDDLDNILSENFIDSNDNIMNNTDLILYSNDDLLNLISTFYQNLGFPFVKVTGPKKVVQKNKIKYQFIVEKNEYVTIDNVYFMGTLPESRMSVLNKLELNNGFFTSRPFIQSKLSFYRDKLKKLYIQNGYLDSRVLVPDFVYLKKDKKVNLIFNDEIGEKYLISKININLNSKLFSPDLDKLNLILKSNDVYNYDKRDSYIYELKSQLLNHGFLYPNIELGQQVEMKKSNFKLVTLNFKIDPGVMVKIGKIDVDGDYLVKKSEIIAVSGLYSGQTFSQLALNKAQNLILRHDLFTSVLIEPSDLGFLNKKEQVLDIVIHVRGRRGYLLSFSPGWGQTKGYRFTTDYSLYHISDDGLSLNISASLSQEKQQSNFASTETKLILGQQFDIGITEPLFKIGSFLTPLDLSLNYDYQLTAKVLTNREYQTVKLTSDWKPSFFNFDWTMSSSIIHEQSKSTSSNNAVIQTIDTPSLGIMEIMNSVTLDNRDSVGWPTKGGLYSMAFGLSRFGIGSDISYNLYSPKAEFFFPLFNQFSGAISIGGFFVVGTKNKGGEIITPPSSRRSTLSDDAIIRGFPDISDAAAPGPLLWLHYDPKSTGLNCATQLASIGGTNLVYFKAETRYRINSFLGLVAFLDTGENFFTSKEVDKINQQIAIQIQNSSANPQGECIVDNAKLIATEIPDFKLSNFLREYWQEAYVSAGLGVRVIIGSSASINLDYGYPLKSPYEQGKNCVQPSEALTQNTAPVCVSRIQDTTYKIFSFEPKLRGAFHLAIGAKF